MRLGIFGWVVILIGCSTAAAPPAAPTESTPAQSGTPLGPPAPPATASVAPEAAPVACTESSQCARGALCCPSNEPRGASPPITPFGPAPPTKYICTNDPVRDCEGHEICGRQACRAPWPPARPMFSPSRTRVEECFATRDCPKDTVCTLYYAHPMATSSFCAYNVTGESTATSTAPLCENDADCKRDLPRWKSVLGNQYASALAAVKCVPLKTPGDSRRACSIPGFGPLP